MKVTKLDWASDKIDEPKITCWPKKLQYLSPGCIGYWAYLLRAFLQARAFDPGKVPVPDLVIDNLSPQLT